MAKTKQTDTKATNDSNNAAATLISIMATADLAAAFLKEAGFALADVDPNGVSYLVMYGLRKSVQDSVSGLVGGSDGVMKCDAKGWAAYLKDARDQGFTNHVDEPPTDDDRKRVAEFLVNAYKQDRLAGIMAGDLQPGGQRGPRLQGVERIMLDVAEEIIRAAATGQKKPMPKGDNLRDLIAKLTNPDHSLYATIRADAEARHAKLAALAESAASINL